MKYEKFVSNQDLSRELRPYCSSSSFMRQPNRPLFWGVRNYMDCAVISEYNYQKWSAAFRTPPMTNVTPNSMITLELGNKYLHA